ncbi:innexin inx2-like [Pollicipes pollicipes]|uniref:innexin inx2-like n=1 Tax=Pollicipes pollicipes TaxID=41117 RepID=UPI001884AA83|nr:innexin inx2-like [Pollicipes pollicipes]
MFDIFGSVKSLIKISPVSIDNNVFRLHYKVTSVMLVIFSLLVTSHQYIGDPIDCYTTSKIPDNVMDTYCWIHSTFSVEQATPQLRGHTPYVGIGTRGKDDTIQQHAYYQWVCFVLFFQALLFSVPRFLWKSWEGGKCKMLVMELDCPLVADEARCDRKKLLVEYLRYHMHNHTFYALAFYLCEVLNFVNVISQIFFINYFLDFEFTTYGTEVLNFAQSNPENRTDPMARIFPKVTKCTFETFGFSGTVQRHDALCVLPLNIVNEKVYVILWFWLVLLAVISGLALIYRLLVIISPQLRILLLRSRARLAPAAQVTAISQRLWLGDWFVLYQLGKNMDPLIFQDVLVDLSRAIDVHV